MIQNKKHQDISHNKNKQPICSTIKKRKNKPGSEKKKMKKIVKHIWVKILKNGPRKICGRQPSKI